MDKKILNRQQYRLAGENTAVKICTWTKNSLRDEGNCYKQQFYGIMSHRCVQMSPAVGYCQNRCVFCWRPIEHTKGSAMPNYDEPEEIIDGCLKGQKELLTGFGGNDKVSKEKLEQSMKPLHFAISLTGEPTLYPKLSKLIQLLKKKGYSTFVVTNGMEPDALAELEQPTQLYLSVDAPNKELFEKIDQPILKDSWKRLQKSLEVIKSRKGQRTCLRFTMIKGLNMVLADKWAEIINVAEPDFVEVKAYMHVGYSKKRLTLDNMPNHDEVMSFAKEICACSGYQVVDEHKRSRVALLMKHDTKDRIMTFKD